MSSPQPIHLKSLDAAGKGAQVEFVWQEDRFGHILYALDGEVRTAVAASQCDSPETGIALVELHPQLESAERPTLFLHGAGGGAQWSMSVEAVEEGALRFDVAARVLRQPVDRRLLYQWHVADSLLLIPGEGTRVEETDEPATSSLQSSEALSVSPPHTLRWRYTIRR